MALLVLSSKKMQLLGPKWLPSNLTHNKKKTSHFIENYLALMGCSLKNKKNMQFTVFKWPGLFFLLKNLIIRT